MTEKRFAIGLSVLFVIAIAMRWSIFGYQYLLISPPYHLLEQIITPLKTSYTQWASQAPIFAIVLVSLTTQIALMVAFNAYKRRLPEYENVLAQAFRESSHDQVEILKAHGFGKIVMLEPLIRLMTVIIVMLLFIKPVVLTVYQPMSIIAWLILCSICALTVVSPLLRNFTDWNRSSGAIITLVFMVICIYTDLFLLLLYITTSNLFQILHQQLQKYKYQERAQ